MTLLDVRGLRVTVPGDPPATVVDGVDLSVDAGEAVCLVGESGSGKTVAVESLTDLVRGARVEGEVRVRGERLDAADRRDLRGGTVGYVLQDGGDALDPVRRVRAQVRAAVARHHDVSRGDADDQAADRLAAVGLSGLGDRYPHELSGGQRQRVAVALALAGDPDLLVADEPTSDLDPPTRAAVLEVLAERRRTSGMGLLLVTHDLGVVAAAGDRAVVVYAGEIVERGPVARLFDRPAHPYTAALLAARPDGPGGGLPGSVPDPADPPDGCRFHPRCPHAVAACRDGDGPAVNDAPGGGRVACVHHGPEGDPSVLDRPPKPRDGDGREVADR
ncbi:MAG: ABC transporter ATP-binding protein [Halobacteriaceae archaeon]